MNLYICGRLGVLFPGAILQAYEIQLCEYLMWLSRPPGKGHISLHIGVRAAYGIGPLRSRTYVR